MPRALVLVTTLLLALPAAAKDRPLTFCIEDGEGGVAQRAIVFVWSEELDIARDAQNAFKVGKDGCVEIEALSWNGVTMPITAWMSLNYEVQAKGFYDVPGTLRVDKRKKRNTKTVMLEKKVGPG